MKIDMDRYQVTILPMVKIFHDPTFNCRGVIDRTTCVELAQDIKEHGLDFPIHVQNYTAKYPFEYRIISGHCRFVAFQINSETEIPCVIRSDLTNELDAREANLRENIQRRDLNLLQEAEAISFFITAGNNINQIARRLGKSPGWVEPRRKLMLLPKMIQDAAAKKIITQGHINQLWAYRDDEERLKEAIREIKERHEKGERAIVIKEDVKITDFAAIRRPKPHEIEEYLITLAKNITNKLPEGSECFAHQVLSWAYGHTSLAQAYVALRRECQRLGLPFNPPADVERIMNSICKV